MTTRPAVFALTALVLHATAALAQAPGDGLRVRAAVHDSAHVDGGSVLTSVFTVQNLGADTARVQPVLTVPRGWAIVMGNTPFTVAPGASDTWLVGVSVPGSAPASSYVLRGALLSSGGTVADSITVRVNERRAIELLSLDVPGWVMAGSRYEARFLVRNR
ncbi:MAG: NEW3 domain-containing protein, partial [Gemmatimonadales bacterium]